MNEDDIKALRQSFSNPFREDLPKPKKNKFGHTILTNSLDADDPVEIDVEIDSNGAISANPSHALIDSPHMIDMIQKFTKNEPSEEFLDSNDSMPSETVKVANNVKLATLLSELDEMDGTSKKFKPHPNSDGSVQISPNTSIGWRHDLAKNCLNKDCLYALPQDAKFCLKCGTAQMPKFCTECGFNFPGMEKFCPDCGTKR